MSVVYQQNFDTLNDGDLNGQDSWSGSTAFDVQTSVVQAGSKAISMPNNTNASIVRAVNATVAGTATIYLRNSNNAELGAGFYLVENTTAKALVRLESSGQISAKDGGSFTNLQAYNSGSWYKIEIFFDCATDSYTVSINDGAASASLAFETGATSIDKIYLSSPTNSGGGTSYFDTLTFESSITEYTLAVDVGAFVLTGVATAFNRVIGMIAGLGEFTLTGVAAALSKGYNLVTSVGEFVLTGVDTIFTKSLNIIAGLGEFTLTGIDAGLLRPVINMAVSVGQFILTGVNAILTATGDALWQQRTKPTTSWSERTKPTTNWTERS